MGVCFGGSSTSSFSPMSGLDFHLWWGRYDVGCDSLVALFPQLPRSCKVLQYKSLVKAPSISQLNDLQLIHQTQVSNGIAPCEQAQSQCRRGGGGGPAERPPRRPPPIILCILRLVPLKYAVRTSVLSRGWPRLWLRALAASPVLDFSDRDFARGQSPTQAAATVRRCLRRHANRGAPLDAFRVAFRSPAGGFRSDVVSWVAAAVARGAKEVAVDLTPTTRWRRAIGDDWGVYSDIDFDGSAFLELPADLFNFKATTNSLSRLALVRCSLRAVPLGAAGLAGLRSLSLSHADVTDEAVESVLLSTCRSLEFLSLRSCNGLFRVRVCGDKLRGLELVRCLGLLHVAVATPALESFVYHGDIAYAGGCDVVVVNLGATPALRDAYLSLIGFGYADEFCCFAYYRMLTCVAHATILTICSVGLKHIHAAQAAAATMNVTELQCQLSSFGNHHIDDVTRVFGMDLPNLLELQLLMPSLCDDDVDRVAGFFEFTRPPILNRLFIRVTLLSLDRSLLVATTIFTSSSYIFNSPAKFVLNLQLSGGKASRASGSGAATVMAGEDEDDAYIASNSDLVLDHLKFIKVVNFRGTRCEVRLLEFLVSRAPALEQLVLLVAVEGEGVVGDEQMKIVQGRVMAMQTASPVFRVVVCRHSEDGSRSPAHTRFYHEE
ncbi:hypothetical protein EJB05_32173, partial [Eragrostis curvula]